MATKRGKKSGKAKQPAGRRVGNDSAAPILEGTASATVVPIVMDNSLLDQEFAYYLAHLPEWYEHEGKHVLIHGQEHFGFFPTRDAALEEGFRRFGWVPFLVKQVRRDEEPRPMTMVIL
jgi:hypothetical protein